MSNDDSRATPETRLLSAAGLLALGIIAAVRWLLPLTVDPAGDALLAVAYCTAALLSIPLVLAVVHRSTRASWRSAGLVVATATLLCVLVMLADPLTRRFAPALPGLAVTLLLISLNVAVLARVVSRSLLLVLLAALLMLPVWAAPLVELAGNPVWARNFVIGASPLTALSLPLDLDYLRTNWFYAHSALGSMRYEYPAWFTLCAFYFLIPAVVLARFVMTSVDLTILRHPGEAHS